MSGSRSAVFRIVTVSLSPCPSTRSHPVPSTCARHKERRGPLPVEDHCITVREHRPFPLKRVYFVDNVITSGNTLEACAQALGFGTGLVYADASRI